MYGPEWLNEVLRYIQEDKKESFTMLTSIMPLAKTPMDEKGARALADYAKSVQKMLNGLTPWEKDKGLPTLGLRGKVKSGEIVVIPDGTVGPNDPLFKDAKVMKG